MNTARSSTNYFFLVHPKTTTNMESLESEAKSGGLVDLSQLSLEQLSHLKKQLEQVYQLYFFFFFGGVSPLKPFSIITSGFCFDLKNTGEPTNDFVLFQSSHGTRKIPSISDCPRWNETRKWRQILETLCVVFVKV